jgi:hypothetical protein
MICSFSPLVNKLTRPSRTRTALSAYSKETAKYV